MKHRRVFSVPDVPTAYEALAAARASGIDDADVLLIARKDIELEELPSDRLDGGTDTMPAAIRGAVGGGAIGLLAGVIAVAVPAFGITIAGVGLLTAIGAMVGTWSAALMGAALPSEVRRRFEDEIERGSILVVLDANKDTLLVAETALKRIGAEPMPFDHLSATS